MNSCLTEFISNYTTFIPIFIYSEILTQIKTIMDETEIRALIEQMENVLAHLKKLINKKLRIDELINKNRKAFVFVLLIEL